jgi:DNA-binding MarR family transcriptional regulator
MVATGTGRRMEELAQDLFEFITQLGLMVPRGRRPSADLKEVEFLTLAILQAHGTMIVGDIQRLLGVLPAQMSRIIRALETRDPPLITCQINPRDKRKIDVQLTAAGEKALHDYQAAWVTRIRELLADLPEEDKDELGRLVEKLRDRQIVRSE